MKFYLLLSFVFIQSSLFANDPVYQVLVKNKEEVRVQGRFQLLNDTIYIYQRGITAELPEGEAGFVKELSVMDEAGNAIKYQYAGEGNWILQNVKPGQMVNIEYQMLTTHKNYNWNHVGGVDESAFVNGDGLFFTGYAFFIIPDVNMKNVQVNFQLPAGWKASTPWQREKENNFKVESGRFLVNNCFMLGTHQESVINVAGMEMRLAISNKLAYAKPLIEKTMRKLIPAYQQLFGGSPAPTYLVVMNEERVTDGSAFRRSFSQIFKDTIDEKGIPTWGYIMAHEIFHLWNGHAILPADQEEWFKEGFTDYMTNVMLRRAGLINDEIVYRKLEHIARRYWLDRVWQRDTVSIRETGEHKEQLRFGVYGGGAIVGIALDVEMRKATNNQKGVADIMYRLFQEFAKTGKPYAVDDIIRIANEETGKDLKPFFDRYVTGREFLDIQPYINAMGLDFHTAIEEMYVSPNKKATPLQKQLYQEIFVN
jgi:predicted metalloprotease with PDZ domain